ncbi:hypothetical protein B296_00008107 [Ensete ventricosum]|uniref:Uncharacterized protein n=1 Tax=Ensete ventricosum TaxID=4639 RepID=A0A427A018_ENSVE|nr:hypothetical protein B296_00008107 [Ensete ventricosum]
MERRQRQSSVDDAVIAADHLRVRKQLGEAAAVDVHVDGGGTSVSRSAPPSGTSAARRGPPASAGCTLGLLSLHLAADPGTQRRTSSSRTSCIREREGVSSSSPGAWLAGRRPQAEEHSLSPTRRRVDAGIDIMGSGGQGGDDGTPSGGEVWIIGYTATPQAEVCMAAPRSHLRCCICSNKGPRTPLRIISTWVKDIGGD